MAETIDRERQIVVGDTDAGEPYTLPIEEILTGRMFGTGKSGSGKSNTGSVIVEELLDRSHSLMIVDTDGEYWGLKEEFEILHVGATEECDLQVSSEHAPKLAELALDQHVPIVLDVSGYVDTDEADALVRETAQELFAREQQQMQPFLLLVEEIHEFIPEGSLDETGKVLIRIAKRGRKRGLGIAGFSQRPANVKKDFITQADLLVWHRLTWKNDTKVVKDVVGNDYADEIDDLADGEAFVQADWSEADVERVQFRRKRTFDAGATPGLDDIERPELKSIDEDLVDELNEISEQHDRRQDRIAELEATVEEKEDRIAELEDELEDARDLQRLGEAFVDAAQSSGEAGLEAEQQELLEEKNETISDLRERVDDLEATVDELEAERDELADEVERLRSVEDRVEQAEEIEAQLEEVTDWFATAPPVLREAAGRVEALFADVGVDGEDLDDVDVDDALREEVEELRAQLDDARSTVQQLRDEKEQLEKQATGSEDGNESLGDLVDHEAVQAAVDVAKDNCDRADRHVDRVLAVLASSDGGSLSVDEITPLVEGSKTTVRQACKALFEAGVVRRDTSGRAHAYALDEEFLERRIEVAEQQS